MKYLIIATIKISQINNNFIKYLNENSNIILRFNGSHINIDELNNNKKIFDKIKNRVLIDLPCNKIRYKTNIKVKKIEKGKKYKLFKKYFNIQNIFEYLHKNTFVYMNDKLLKLEIKKINQNYIEVLSHDDGYIYHNRGVVFDKISNELDLFTKKDYELINFINCSTFTTYAGISFVRNMKDISLSKNLINKNLILKLETPKAVKNINSFAKQDDFILLDRGDLISFYGINKIENIIDKIITRLVSNKIIIATQMYYSHLGYNQPSISDLIILRKLCSNKNIVGFQLSEETALSKEPINVLKSFNQSLINLKK